MIVFVDMIDQDVVVVVVDYNFHLIHYNVVVVVVVVADNYYRSLIQQDVVVVVVVEYEV